jgi:beta-lactamase class D
MALPVLLVAAGCTAPSDDAAGPPGSPTLTPTPPAATAPDGAAGLDVEVRDDLVELFRDAGVDGTFVLYDVAGDRLVTVNPARAEQPFVPASTFKIPHSLIALETGAVADEHEIVPYGDRPQPVAAWEQDMALPAAVRDSNVPVFQELARRIGIDAEREWLVRLGYGNTQVGVEVERFWLDGPLEISAVEQVQWLARLARQELPASADHQAVVRDLVLVEDTGRYVLYGKTGWATDVTPQVGWWVGWVERDGDVYAFALNMDLGTADDAGLRIPLGRDLLHRLEVLPDR